MEEITIEKIKERIKENLRRSRKQLLDSESNILSEKLESTAAYVSTPSKTLTTEKTDDSVKNYIDGRVIIKGV
ncbi:MAG: hypothetical protein OHK0032_11820 [Thermodesulfovibrionales bacterium]